MSKNQNEPNIEIIVQQFIGKYVVKSILECTRVLNQRTENLRLNEIKTAKINIRNFQSPAIRSKIVDPITTSNTANALNFSNDVGKLQVF